jgi:cytochrome c biogenesis protein CcmG/thiol:disulfide interchange protein DsbE
MTRPPWLVLLPPALFAGLAGLFYAGMLRDDPDALPTALAGREAPAVVVEPLEGLVPFSGDVLDQPGVKLVNFWASWCAPCRAEHPNLEALAAEGIPIYGVNYKDDPEKARAFLDELGDPFVASGADRSGRMALNWGVYGVPETYVIDGQGRIVMRFAGPITERALQSEIRPAMAEAAD